MRASAVSSFVLFALAVSANALTWFEYNGHEYALTTARGDWGLANSEAASHGGYLVAIGSAEEEQFLHATFADVLSIPLWIGLTDEASEGTWVWSNGEPIEYLNWILGEPNNGLIGEEDHAVMNWRHFEAGRVGWNDWYETSALRTFDPPGIIERSAAGVPDASPTLPLLLASLVALAVCRVGTRRENFYM